MISRFYVKRIKHEMIVVDHPSIDLILSSKKMAGFLHAFGGYIWFSLQLLFLHFAAVYLSISSLFHNDNMVDGETLISTLTST